MTDVDVVILSRGGGPLRPEVQQGLARQWDVRLHVYRVRGGPRLHDPCRWESIVRGRNLGKALGRSPWLMFLDDDVVLAPDCVRRLVDQLGRQPIYAALAADYLGQAGWGGLTRHVAMGATLFRRQVLDQIRFRWEAEKCECQCCCDDLRRLGYGIAYEGTARARHLPHEQSNWPAPPPRPPRPQAVASGHQEGHILAAFDRRHYRVFCDQFLQSLRTAGNDEWVTAVCYGLFPRQRRILQRMRHVQVLELPAEMTSPPIRRLRDFQTALAMLEPTLPVAYWDAGDVWFQGSLQPLWSLVGAHPNKLLAVREPISHPQNAAVAEWTLSIQHAPWRDRAFRLLAGRPFLNSGFAAATAETMLRYLRYAHRLRHASLLRGTRDWGDQLVLNLYCHANPESWQELDQQWNYCLFGRQKGEVHRREDGRFVNRAATPIRVVHGNARTLTRVGHQRQRL